MADLRAALRARLPGLKPSEAAVVRLVLEDPQFVLETSTAKTAERAGVSPATVVRASRSAGFEGFRELRLAVARASGHPGTTPPAQRLSAASTPAQMRETILDSHASSVRAIRGTLDPEALDAAVRAVARAPRVLTAGAGTSSAVALDAAFRLTSIGVMVHSPTDHYASMVITRLLGLSDVVLAVSHTGETAQTLSIAEAAAAAGATVIAVTSFSSSSLAQTAEVPLIAGGQDPGLELGASSSRLAHLTVIDMLHAGVALHGPQPAS